MKPFAAIALSAVLLAGPASAFSLSVGLPNLDFPATNTTISTLSCSVATTCK